jgi:hypothetical protein
MADDLEPAMTSASDSSGDPGEIPAPQPAVPPDLPLPAVERLNDFPDRLSPMLVKELRQGLRTYTFVILFLVLQGLLALVLLTASAIAHSTNADGAGDVVSKIVFCFYALALLVVQPLRGVSSISIEVKQNTIDLMVLTRLSAWRIVFGKWSSIVSQSGLILLAVAPYLILRYFFGGMQLFGELYLMIYIFVISSVLTAITIGLSAVSNIIVRGLLPIAGAVVAASFVFGSLTPELPMFVDALGGSSRELLASTGFLILTIYTGYYFLDLAATMIAPAAENRSTRKRLIGLGVFTAAFWSLQSTDIMVAVVVAGYVLVLLAVDALTERREIPSVVCEPFMRFSAMGRVMGRFLYPGWPAFLAIHGQMHGANLNSWAAAGMIVAIAVFPAAFIQLFARNTNERFSVYLAVSITGWVLASILGMLFDVVSETILLWIFAPIPMVLAPLSGHLWSAGTDDPIILVSWGLAGAYYFVIFAAALPILKGMGRLEDEATERRMAADDH